MPFALKEQTTRGDTYTQKQTPFTLQSQLRHPRCRMGRSIQHAVLLTLKQHVKQNFAEIENRAYEEKLRRNISKDEKEISVGNRLTTVSKKATRIMLSTQNQHLS